MSKVLICDDEPLLRQLMRVALLGDYDFEEAGTVEEAVRRHGGEAELARRGFEQLPDTDRTALLAFLRSL